MWTDGQTDGRADRAIAIGRTQMQDLSTISKYSARPSHKDLNICYDQKIIRNGDLLGIKNKTKYSV